MKIVQVVSGIGMEASGPSYSVPGLCRGLAVMGCGVILHFAGKDPRRCFIHPYVCHLLDPYLPSNVKVSSKMLSALRLAAMEVDIIHSNGLWMMPNVYPWWACKGTKCKLVVAPRGTLADWSLKKGWLKKKIFGWLLQNAVLRHADMFHATCEKEYEEIRARGYKQPVAIVPIGMDLPTRRGKTTEHTEYTEGCCAQDCQCGDKTTEGASRQLPLATENERLKRVVFFGRVHKVKAVDHLVKAWGQLQESLPDWELVIAGPDCGAMGELEAIIAEENIPRVRFVGEINGPAKYDFLTEADIYVLPSHTENFGVTVAEALACGTPTIASQGTPWEGLETEQCGKWVPIGVEPLVEALRELTSLTDDERAEMGERGRAWIQRDFSWDGIGAKMKAAYAWLLGQGDKPDFVRMD